MAKNIMPDIAKLLGVEINEEFELRVVNQPLIKCTGTFCITDNNIVGRIKNGDVWQPWEKDSIYDLFNGTLEVVRKPFRPKQSQEYWTYSGDKWKVVNFSWCDTVEDYALLKAGCVFRTKEEAEQNLPRKIQELKNEV